VLEVCQLTRTAKHQDQVTPAHRDDRQFRAHRTPLRQVPLGHHLPRHVFARAWAAEYITDAELRGEPSSGESRLLATGHVSSEMNHRNAE
jgi:hypothetical protein